MKENNFDIFEYFRDCIIVLSSDGFVRYANRVALGKLLYGKHELETLSVEEFLVSFGNTPDWRRIKGELFGRPLYFEDVYIISKMGTMLPFSLTCFKYAFPYNEDEESIFLIFVDTAKDKQKQIELENKNIEMARINSELIKNNNELKKVSELKTKFLSIASHELKTPLTTVKGYAELIVDNMSDKADESVINMVKNINKSADRLHSVINDMLDLSRIEQNRLRLKPEKLSLIELLNEAVSDLSHFSTVRKIRIILVKKRSSYPPFYADRARILQVFINLLSNAIKYSPDESVVRVIVDLSDEDSVFYLIVKDEGVGINSEEHKKIFEPFYEVQSSYKHSTGKDKFMGGGTGLGLSIVRGIINRHGGEIWVESDGENVTENNGSEFHVILPVRSSIDWDDDETQIIKLDSILRDNHNKVKKEKKNNSGNEKPFILYIDDDNESVEMTLLVLKKKYNIMTVSTGEEGIREAFLRKPDLILLDMYLPGLDGLTVSRILKSQPETKDIPIAFFSAATQNEEIEKSYASGGNHFIVKPFKQNELISTIESLLG